MTQGTFGDFSAPGTPVGLNDYIVGYAAGGGTGSDRRWQLSEGLYLKSGKPISWNNDAVVISQGNHPDFGGIYRFLEIGPKFTDPSNVPAVGIGTEGRPMSQLHISAAGARGTTYPFDYMGPWGLRVTGVLDNSSNLTIEAIGSGAQTLCEYTWTRARGTGLTAPARLEDGDVIGQWLIAGYTDTISAGYFSGLGAAMNVQAKGAYTGTSHGAIWNFSSVRQGSTTLTATLSLYGGSIMVGGAADPGPGGHIGLQASATLVWNAGAALLQEVSGSLIYISDTSSASFAIQKTNAGATGAILTLDHATASPAVNDIVGWIKFTGRDSGAAVENYAQIYSQIISTTAGAESSVLALNTRLAGADQALLFDGTQFYSANNNVTALGVAGLAYTKLFLGSGGFIDFNNNDGRITHSSDLLTISGAGLTLAAGTTTIAPLKLQSGTNLTTAAAGAYEYDGNAIYTTPVASNRGVSPSVHFLSLSANQTGTDTASAQVWFPGGGATGITVAASTTYFFEGVLALQRSAGTTAHTTGVLFGGTATLTSIGYEAMNTNSTAFVNTNNFEVLNWISVATDTQITASSSASNEVVMIHLRGIVRINGSGTFIPQFKYSAAPGGAPTVQANSYFRMYPLGTNSVLSVGNWS